MNVLERKKYNHKYYLEHRDLLRDKYESNRDVYLLKMKDNWQKRKDVVNAKRRERYSNDAGYREEIKAKARCYSKTDKGRERNRENSRKRYHKLKESYAS